MGRWPQDRWADPDFVCQPSLTGPGWPCRRPELHLGSKLGSARLFRAAMELVDWIYVLNVLVVLRYVRYTMSRLIWFDYIWLNHIELDGYHKVELLFFKKKLIQNQNVMKHYVLFLWIQDHRSMRFGKLELQHLQNHVELTKLSADSWGEPREACSLAAVKLSRVQNLGWLSRVVGCTSQCIGDYQKQKLECPLKSSQFTRFQPTQTTCRQIIDQI